MVSSHVIYFIKDPIIFRGRSSRVLPSAKCRELIPLRTQPIDNLARCLQCIPPVGPRVAMMSLRQHLIRHPIPCAPPKPTPVPRTGGRTRCNSAHITIDRKSGEFLETGVPSPAGSSGPAGVRQCSAACRGNRRRACV
jgi:hypothetical protein